MHCPFPFPAGVLNGKMYLDFLENILPELMENVPLRTRLEHFYQQDGAPAHNTNAVTNFLNFTYGDRWVGNRSIARKWPSRSPDLNPLDFFLWGYMKDRVYAEPVLDLEDLKTRIKAALQDITPQDGIWMGTLSCTLVENDHIYVKKLNIVTRHKYHSSREDLKRKGTSYRGWRRMPSKSLRML